MFLKIVLVFLIYTFLREQKRIRKLEEHHQHIVRSTTLRRLLELTKVKIQTNLNLFPEEIYADHQNTVRKQCEKNTSAAAVILLAYNLFHVVLRNLRADVLGTFRS